MREFLCIAGPAILLVLVLLSIPRKWSSRPTEQAQPEQSVSGCQAENIQKARIENAMTDASNRKMLRDAVALARMRQRSLTYETPPMLPPGEVIDAIAEDLPKLLK